jgi:hypothetical protein
MQLKLSQFQIPIGAPFANDKLNRKEVAESLSVLIKNIKIPFVIGIDSYWGSGKTTFIKMWRQSLINDKIPTIYYNAWENDFSSSALISLLGEIDKGLDELHISTSRRKKLGEKLDGAKKISVDLVKRGVPIALKVLTSGVIDANQAIESAFSEFTEEYSKDMINKYEKAKYSISSFRKKLYEFIKEATKGSTIFANKPFIIFIDELDRCRPNFALEILEKSKHLFNIEGIIFIYSIEKEHLGNSIKTIYGSEMDVDGYLRRFFDIIYKLPESKIEDYSNYLFDKYNISDYFKDRTVDRYDFINLKNIFSHLFTIFNFSLRTQEQVFTQFVICLLSTPKNVRLFAILLGTLLCIKASNPKLYYNFINRRATGEDIIDFLNSNPSTAKLFTITIGFIIEGYLIAIVPKGDSIDKLKYPLFEKYIKESESDPENSIKKERVNKIRNIIQNDEMENPEELLRYIVNKLEFIDKIKEENLSLLT